MKPINPFFTSVRNNAAALGLYLILWALFSFFFPAYLVPSPLTVLGDIEGYLHPEFLRHLGATLFRVGTGFSGAFLLGSTVGILSVVIRKAPQVNAFLVLLQVMPGTIVGIIFLLAFGIGHWVPIVLVVFLILPLVSINTANALLKRNSLLENYLRSIGGKRRHQIRYLYLPALIATFQSNLTIGFGLSLKVVILGEFIGAQEGIGYLLNISKIYFDMDQVFFYLLVVLSIMGCFQVVQNLLFTLFLKPYFYPD